MKLFVFAPHKNIFAVYNKVNYASEVMSGLYIKSYADDVKSIIVNFLEWISTSLKSSPYILLKKWQPE